MFRLSAFTAIRMTATTLFLAASLGTAHAQATVYTQPYDGTSSLFASQNDTSGGFGNFATTYDNFTLAASTSVTEADWVGGYFNPATQAPISQFTVTFWSDSAGQPGSALTTETIAGTATETFVSNDGNSAVYSYAATLPTAFTATAGTQYWMSVVPDVGFPPQWGWASGTGGDGAAVQDFFGGRSTLAADMAFTLKGSSVPEASSMIGLGSLVLGGGLLVLRRRK